MSVTLLRDNFDGRAGGELGGSSLLRVNDMLIYLALHYRADEIQLKRSVDVCNQVIDFVNMFAGHTKRLIVLTCLYIYVDFYHSPVGIPLNNECVCVCDVYLGCN